VLFVVLPCRGLTVHQAARFSQLQKLQVARLDLQTSSDISDVEDTAGPEVPVDSHPISVSAWQITSQVTFCAALRLLVLGAAADVLLVCPAGSNQWAPLIHWQ
jgi:hypothetical protein